MGDGWYISRQSSVSWQMFSPSNMAIGSRVFFLICTVCLQQVCQCAPYENTAETTFQVTPNQTVFHVAESDEAFFSFVIKNLPPMDDHSIQGTVQKFVRGRDTPLKEVINIASTPEEVFPRRNSTEEKGFAMTRSFTATSTGGMTLELFFRVMAGRATRNLTAMLFTLVYIAPGSSERRTLQESKDVRIMFGRDEREEGTEASMERLPCKFAGENSGKQSLSPFSTVGTVLVAVLSYLHTLQS